MGAYPCPVSSGTGPVGWGEGEYGETSSGGDRHPGSGRSGSGSPSSRQQMMSLCFLPMTSFPVDDQAPFVSPQ